MKQYLLLLALGAFVWSCKDAPQRSQEPTEPSPINTFAIVIHGGAGSITKARMSPEREAEYRAKLTEAVSKGYSILKAGGSSLDAVEQTIKILEDSPLFNAGKGAVFTNAETNELDASIMEGKTLNAGASAGTKTVKNPISLARAVMEQSPHVMLAREGAETFAAAQGLELVDPQYFATEKSLETIKRIKARENQSTAQIDTHLFNDSKFGTVGCVALDQNGNIAAGTSTGGMSNKRWGRIGDSPIIGAGTYANNNTCGISSTGWGEFYIRSVAAYDISALMAYKGLSLKEAAEEVVLKKIPEMGGDGGIIAIDKLGHIEMIFNTEGMFRASMDESGKLYVGMYKSEANN